MKIVQSLVRSLRLHGDYLYEESRRNKKIRTRGEYVHGVYGEDKQRWKAQRPLGRLGQVANQMTAMLQAHHWPTTRPSQISNGNQLPVLRSQGKRTGPSPQGQQKKDDSYKDGSLRL